LALAATAAYYGSCWRWDGFEWINVCYQPYYGYAPYSYVGYSTYWWAQLGSGVMRRFSAAASTMKPVRARRPTKPAGLRLRKASGMTKASDIAAASKVRIVDIRGAL